MVMGMDGERHGYRGKRVVYNIWETKAITKKIGSYTNNMENWHNILRNANVYVKYRQGLKMTRDDIWNVVRAIPTRTGPSTTTNPSVPFALSIENKAKVMAYHDLQDVFSPSKGKAMLAKVRRRAEYVFKQTGIRGATQDTKRSPRKSPRRSSRARSGNRRASSKW